MGKVGKALEQKAFVLTIDSYLAFLCLVRYTLVFLRLSTAELPIPQKYQLLYLTSMRTATALRIKVRTFIKLKIKL